MDNIFDLAYYQSNQKDGSFCYHEAQCLISLFEYDDTFVKQIEPDYPNMVCTQISYYQETLSIQEKGQYLKHGGTEIGTWEKYDKTGTLIETENMDEHFLISWQQMEEILKNKKISLLTADSIYRYYDEEKDTATWSIVIKLPLDKGCLYVFDARTGELIKEEVIDMRKEL